MLPEQPKKPNFQEHMAPKQLGGRGNISVETEYHKIRSRRRACADDIGMCVPLDMKDYQVECAMRRRMQRGGATFTPKQIMFKQD